MPLDVDLLESLDINDKPKEALIEEFRNRGILKGNREIDVDYGQDIEGVGAVKTQKGAGTQQKSSEYKGTGKLVPGAIE